MLRWRIAILVSAAIAISYLDRQTLPVAIKAISTDIPLTNVQFSNLQSAFLLAYAFMYAGGGKLSDTLGTRRGFIVIMIFWSLACASHGLALTFTMLAVSRFAAGHGRRRRLPHRDPRRSRMVFSERTSHRHGHNQRRHRRGSNRRAATHRGDSPVPKLALDFFLHRRAGPALDRLVAENPTSLRANIPRLSAQDRDKLPPIIRSLPPPQEKSRGSICCASKKPGASSPQNSSVTPPGTSISSGCPNISTTRATSTSKPSAPSPGSPTPPQASAASLGGWFSSHLVRRKSHSERSPQNRPRPKRRRNAADPARHARSHRLGHRNLQPGLFRTAILVHAGNGSADRSFSQQRSGRSSRPDRFRRRHGRHSFRRTGRLPARSRIRLRDSIHTHRHLSRNRFPRDTNDGAQCRPAQHGANTTQQKPAHEGAP